MGVIESPPMGATGVRPKGGKPDEAGVMTEFECALLKHLERLVATQDRIADALERLAPTETADPVLLALGETFGRDPFTASEAIAAAMAARDEAQAAGVRTPNLPRALQAADIETAHALGRFLRGFEGRETARIGQERQGVIWQLAVSRGDENADMVRLVRRRA